MPELTMAETCPACNEPPHPRSTQVETLRHTNEPGCQYGPDRLPCAHCQTNYADGWWVGDGGIVALAHGFKAAWCNVCMTQAQLDHARAMVARLLTLEHELLKAKAEARPFR